MKRRATGIQKIEPKPKKRNTSPSASLSSSFSNEEKDAYRMKKGAYILTWHDTSLLDTEEDSYQRVFYKKEVTISSDSGRAKINISNLGPEELNLIIENLMESNDTRGIEIQDEDGIKVRGQKMDTGMGLEDGIEYFVTIPFQTNVYNYDEDTARGNQYGKYYRFGDDMYTVTKREFIIREDPKTARMQVYKLTEAGRVATNQDIIFGSGPVPYWEKVPILKQELTFYRYTNSNISNNEELISGVQRELGTYQFSVDRLPVDTPYEVDDLDKIKSVEREPYNNMSENSWAYNTFTDERKFTVTFTMEIMEAVSNQTAVRRDNQSDQMLCTTYEYDSKYINSQLQLFDSHFWRGAQIPPPIKDGDWFYQIQVRNMEFCLQLRGIDLNDIVREPEYEEVRWYLRMYLREIDINRLLLVYTPTIIPVIHDNQLFRQRRLYDNLLTLKF